MRIVGIDENGLGPRLGPLIATAASIEVQGYDAKRLRSLGREIGIADSKQTSGFGHMSRAESLTLAIAESAASTPITTADDLLEVLGLDTPKTLRSVCPGGPTESQCWGETIPLPAFGGSLEKGRKMLAELAQGGVKVSRVRTVIACADMVNTSLAAGHSKVHLDLLLFERLILDARKNSPSDLTAICGMVGGIRKYPGYFRLLNNPKSTAEPCVYSVPKVGEVRFEIKADDRHLPVGLSSMVGKVVRELGMRRIVRFYQSHDSSLADVSGYHDRVTAKFVESSAKLRRSLKIVPGCFER